MIKYKNLYVIPTYHEKINFSFEVRKLFAQIMPDAVAVEFPENLRLKIMEGINRLPALSLVVYFDEYLNELLYIPIEPCDSMIEGIRLSIESNISCYFIDLSVKNYRPHFYRLPDDEAMKEIGLDRFYEILKKNVPYLFHLDEIPFKGFKQNYTNDFDLKPPFINTSSEFDINNGDHKSSEKDFEKENYFKIIDDSGLPPIFKKLQNAIKTLDQAREYYMAANLKSLMELHEKILVIVGMAHWERIKKLLENEDLVLDILDYNPPIDAEIYNVPPKNKALLLTFNEIPFIAFQYEHYRTINPLTLKDIKISPRKFKRFDRTEFISEIYIRAEDKFFNRYRERLSLNQLMQLKQYLRNLVFIDNILFPDTYHMVIAAKNIVDDDFAWFTYKACMNYPFALEKDKDIPNLDIIGNKIRFKGKFIKFRRRIPIKGKVKPFKIKKVEEPKKGEDWKKEWDENRFDQCSYPEEDIILEEKYQYIRNFGQRVLTEKFTKIHKFEGSLLDGIDIRETIRNWINGQHIYVKEFKKISGDITSFIMIFDDEPLPYRYQHRNDYEDEKYPHNINFYAEHEKESDLAFFSTKPGDIIVGPGISVVKLGGFISEFPPRSIFGELFSVFDTQTNFLFNHCRLKSERLLTAAIYWAKGKFILYIDKKRPKQYYYHLAHANNKQIIFVPITAFSTSTIERLKYMHVLAGKFRRKYAHKYIDLKRKFKF
ncbi:MAG: hypothetical protein ACTSRZ_11445 [Promethearchaeota archaeon]